LSVIRVLIPDFFHGFLVELRYLSLHSQYFSDAKTIPLGKGTKQFFFLATRKFFLQREKKYCAKEKSLGVGKNYFLTDFIKGNFLGVRKKF